jgi:hypothetical protein
MTRIQSSIESARKSQTCLPCVEDGDDIGSILLEGMDLVPSVQTDHDSMSTTNSIEKSSPLEDLTSVGPAASPKVLEVSSERPVVSVPVYTH